MAARQLLLWLRMDLYDKDSRFFRTVSRFPPCPHPPHQSTAPRLSPLPLISAPASPLGTSGPQLCERLRCRERSRGGGEWGLLMGLAEAIEDVFGVEDGGAGYGGYIANPTGQSATQHPSPPSTPSQGCFAWARQAPWAEWVDWRRVQWSSRVKWGQADGGVRGSEHGRGQQRERARKGRRNEESRAAEGTRILAAVVARCLSLSSARLALAALAPLLRASPTLLPLGDDSGAAWAGEWEGGEREEGGEKCPQHGSIRSAHIGGGGGMVGSSVGGSHGISVAIGRRSLDSSGGGVVLQRRGSVALNRQGSMWH
ncbi:unnamed protein product [Closterium sp. NIES-64]|nr:unnamed protein product [Closterium sp. NIES-64]